MRNGSETKFVQQLILYAASAALSCLVLFVGLKHLDPNHEASKKALEQKKELAKRLGRPLVSTNPYEDVVACDVVNPDHIDVKFDSIGGLDAIKQSLYELVILPLRRPELFSHGKLLCPQKGVLLYGPPGTGKTMLAKAIAKESGAAFINVRISNLMSKWFGDAQKLVTAVFTLAYKLQPAIIFIDEVDSFLGQRKTTDHEALTNMKTEFMALWDGFTTDRNAKVMVLAATNRPSELDEAILRRLPQAFQIGIPDCRERAAILKVILKNEKIEVGIDYDRIANLCDGYTGSDLLELCKKAAYFPIRELLNDEKSGKSSSEPRPLSMVDLEGAKAIINGRLGGSLLQPQKQKLLQVNIDDLIHNHQDGRHKENQTIIRIDWTAGKIFKLTARILILGLLLGTDTEDSYVEITTELQARYLKDLFPIQICKF